MINLTRIYLGTEGADVEFGNECRPGQDRLVVVWNITRRCNLHCLHCYSDSEPKAYCGELTMDECRRVIDDLASFGVSAVMLSGGEPLAHPQFFSLARYAAERGVPLILSTNGTLLHRAPAFSIREIGFSHVGISLNGTGDVHDTYCGRGGAFDAAVQALRNCRHVGQQAGLRITLTRHTIENLPAILDFIEEEDISHVSFCHLVFSGRGIGQQLVDPVRVREGLDTLIERMRQWHAAGIHREILTIDQPADAAYLYLKMLDENPSRARDAMDLMQREEGGNEGSGIGIANIDGTGNVHPDPFWQTHTLGNVRDRPFSEIWTQSNDDILLGLRDRLPRLRGRCASCRFQRICGGGFRARAAQMHNDPWAQDPGCYLSDQEIAAN